MLAAVPRDLAGANLVGTLPPAACPLANVFTIVHTGSGTYTDLAV